MAVGKAGDLYAFFVRHVRSAVVGLFAIGALLGCDGQPQTAATGPTAFPWQAVDAGLTHACALADGIAYCWGNGVHGQLGIDPSRLTQSQSLIPIAVKGVPPLVEIGVGDDFTCGLTEGGEVYCWGENYWGQLGRGEGNYTNEGFPDPELIDSALRFSSIEVGYLYVCAISEPSGPQGERAYCWGRNRYGQLGNGQSGATIWWDAFPQPEAVRGDLRFRSLSAGTWHTCGITHQDDVYCWGLNDHGQLGIQRNIATTSAFPVKISDIKLKHISVDGLNSCGITPDDTAVCWGDNVYGQLGNGQFGVGSGAWLIEEHPVQVQLDFKPTDIAVGYYFACAARHRRIPAQPGAADPFPLVRCWGRNDMGQVGIPGSNELCNGSVPCFPTARNLKVMAHPRLWTGDQPPVGSIEFRAGVSGGVHMACALVRMSSGFVFAQDARLYCWGSGPLGDGSGQDSDTPVLVRAPN